MARRKSNPGNEMGMIILLGGGAAAVWYLMNYGPNGAVSSGNVSYLNTWLYQLIYSGEPASTTAAAPVTTVAAPAPVNTIQNPTVPTPVVVAPTPTPAPQTPPPTTLVIPANLTVSPNINSSLSGNVTVNGQTQNLSIITGSLGQSSGVIYDTSGHDLTSQFSANQQQALVQAFLTALANQTFISVPGAPQPQQQPIPQAGVSISGLGNIMQLSPFISPATNGVRDPASLGLAGLASLGRISRRKGWGSLNLGSVPTGRYLQ